MNSLCDLAATGINTQVVQIVAGCILLVSFILLWQTRSGKRLYSMVSILVLLSLGLFTLKPREVLASSQNCSSTATGDGQSASVSPKVWQPSGRFTSIVFDSGDIDTEVVPYGFNANFSGGSETLYMTINQPNSSVDTESKRPLIVALTGGDTAGFCDSSFSTEQAGMLELAQMGYVTVTLTPLLDPAFCDGEPAQSYYDNFLLNLEATNKALEYLYTNEVVYKIDPETTALYGYSIGGQTALLKLREDHDEAPHIKVLAGFAAIAPTHYDPIFSALTPATSTSPKVLMISFEPDTGYGPGEDPDARADCLNLVSIGYECQFGGLTFPAHPVHANSVSPFVVSPSMTPVNEYFQAYLYNNLVAD